MKRIQTTYSIGFTEQNALRFDQQRIWEVVKRRLAEMTSKGIVESGISVTEEKDGVNMKYTLSMFMEEESEFLRKMKKLNKLALQLPKEQGLELREIIESLLH